jgi:hypothetical protein
LRRLSSKSVFEVWSIYVACWYVSRELVKKEIQRVVGEGDGEGQFEWEIEDVDDNHKDYKSIPE